MEFLSDILVYDFLQRAVISAIVTGIISGVIGVYMVSRRLVFFAGGITHSAFGGLGVAYYLGVNTLWGALAAGVISAFAMDKMTSRGEIKEDSAIGILWSVGMAIGIIFILLTPGYAPNLMNFLFGNILLVTWYDVIMLTIFSLVVVMVMILMGRKIVYVALDGEFAATQHLPVRMINNMMLLMMSLSIILSLKVVGIMLLLSLLTIPAVISSIISQGYRNMTIWSSVISVLGLFLGILISYRVDLPSSAVTVIILFTLLVLIKITIKVRNAILL